MDGFGGFGPMDPFGGRTFGGNPFAMHHSLFDMGPSMFGTDPFMNDSMGGFLMGPEAFQSPFRQQTERKNRSQSDSQIQRQRQNSGQDQFAYQFQSWSSTGNGSGERIERHFSARGSTDDNMHHVSEAVRNKDGRLQSRQVLASSFYFVPVFPSLKFACCHLLCIEFLLFSFTSRRTR